ncbi:MAG: hypothetical protein OER88_12150, partial [Planctomycetota bacterium]|nr:hypothetical protein [Planctomycetota bacterium]
MWARHTPPDGTSNRRGERLLVSLQQASDVESSTLAATAAFLKLRHLALTVDYAGAAVQVTELQKLENMSRRSRGLPEIDLKAQAEAFRREALLGDLITIYEELYQATLKEVVLSVASTALKNYYLGKTRPPAAPVPGKPGAPKGYQFPWDQVGTRLWGAANPWAGKFSINTVIGAGEGAIKKGFSQTLAKHQNMFTAAEIEGVVDAVFTVTKDTIVLAAGDALQVAADRYAGWKEQRRREQEAIDAQQGLDEHRERNLRPLERELAALRRDGEDPERQAQIVEELIAYNRDPNVEVLRARLLAAQGDMDGAAERMRGVYEEAEEAAELIASEMTRAHTLDRIRGRDPTDAAARRRLAAEFAAGDFRKRLAQGEVTYDDLERLVDPTDPLALHNRVLGDELDLAVVRRAVVNAMRNDPNRAMEIQTVALAIDKLRRRRMQELAQEFVHAEGLERVVETIAQDGPRAGDPESAGLLDDIGLVVQLKDGDDAAQRRVEERFQAFLSKKGYAVGGRGGLVARVRAGTSSRARSPSRRPEVPEEWDADTDLPPTRDGRPLRDLDDDALAKIETEQGFQKEHAAGMHRFAQQYRTFLIMRDGNPDSVKFFNNRFFMPKPQSCKAKTAKVGPHIGLVVDPTHETQANEWDKAIKEAEVSDPPRARKLKADRQKAIDTWAEHGEGMKLKGYRVNPASGVIEFVGKDKQGRVRVWTGVHGDYDLHGAYRLMPDGTVRKIGFGGGSVASNTRYARFRGVINQTLAAIFGKEFIQHGAQDNWQNPDKKSDPPVTVFFPDGRPPLRLETPDEMRRFY